MHHHHLAEEKRAGSMLLCASLCPFVLMSWYRNPSLSFRTDSLYTTRLTEGKTGFFVYCMIVFMRESLFVCGIVSLRIGVIGGSVNCDLGIYRHRYHIEPFFMLIFTEHEKYPAYKC